MFFINRKKPKIVEEDVVEVVISDKDKIVLGAFCFRGTQKGDFFVKDTATIDLAATVEGNVTALDCDINGLVKGNVFCANNLWLGSSAVVEGSIMAKKAILETGCRVNGTVVLAPKVEIPTLVPKIMEAEKIKGKKISNIQEVLVEKIDIPQKGNPVSNTMTLPEKQEGGNFHKLELPLEQPTESADNWW